LVVEFISGTYSGSTDEVTLTYLLIELKTTGRGMYMMVLRAMQLAAISQGKSTVVVVRKINWKERGRQAGIPDVWGRERRRTHPFIIVR
jgi:hypothetical protein